MTDDPQDAARVALEEAHAACPCRLMKRTAYDDDRPWRKCSGYCACGFTDTDHENCGWTGHAAIDRAARAIFEAGKEHQRQCETLNWPPPLPSWLPKAGE